LLGRVLLDCRDQSGPAGALIYAQEICLFGRNGAIGTAAHERGGRTVYIAEQTDDRRAENGDGEQRQPKS